jgi:Domain of unknown function (DUF4282)
MAAKPNPFQPPASTSHNDGLLSAVWAETRALIAMLFDFSFKRFLTPRLVRILYSLSLLAALLSALAWMASGFRDGVMQGLFTLVTGPIAFLLYVLTARVAMELVLAIFRIAEHIEKLPTSRSDPESRP